MIFDRIEERMTLAEMDNYSWTNISGNGLDITDAKEQNYFNCLNILSNSIAKLPLSIKQDTEKGEIEAKNHQLWDILKLKMNSSMNSYECLKSLILLYKHYGMAGLVLCQDLVQVKMRK